MTRRKEKVRVLLLTKTKKSPVRGDDKDTKEVNLIVATLIATVTFAAAFTMPGATSTGS